MNNEKLKFHSPSSQSVPSILATSKRHKENWKRTCTFWNKMSFPVRRHLKQRQLLMTAAQLENMSLGL